MTYLLLLAIVLALGIASILAELIERDPPLWVYLLIAEACGLAAGSGALAVLIIQRFQP
jgi:hypothetical protein